MYLFYFRNCSFYTEYICVLILFSLLFLLHRVYVCSYSIFVIVPPTKNICVYFLRNGVYMCTYSIFVAISSSLRVSVLIHVTFFYTEYTYISHLFLFLYCSFLTECMSCISVFTLNIRTVGHINFLPFLSYNLNKSILLPVNASKIC